MKLELDMFTKVPCEKEWKPYIETGLNVGKNLGWIVEYWNHEKYGSDILYEVCKIACKQSGASLHYVPIELRTPELCEIACKQYGLALSSVPWRFRTPELCKIACDQDAWALKFVPKELRTPELCEISCKQEGYLFKFVPEDLKEEVQRRLAKAA